MDEQCFSLNTKFIQKLNRSGIKFRYIGGIYDPMTIIITHKNLDICRVDVNRDLNEIYNYEVYWFSIINNINRFKEKYIFAEDLINDIHIALKEICSEGEHKMNNKMYSVSDIRVTASSCLDQDEMTLTVKPLILRSIGLADCDRIREAIESIGETTYTYNEYQKERDKFDIKDVIFNSPATIVLWADGTKTVVKAENEEFDPEKGLAMAIAKKALGNNYGYYDTFKKYVGRYEKKQKKGDK